MARLAVVSHCENTPSFHMLAGSADKVRLALACMNRLRSGERQAANSDQRRAQAWKRRRLSQGHTSRKRLPYRGLGPRVHFALCKAIAARFGLSMTDGRHGMVEIYWWRGRRGLTPAKRSYRSRPIGIISGDVGLKAPPRQSPSPSSTSRPRSCDIVATEEVQGAETKQAVATGGSIHADPSDPIHYGSGGLTFYDDLLHLESDFEVGPGPEVPRLPGAQRPGDLGRRRRGQHVRRPGTAQGLQG